MIFYIQKYWHILLLTLLCIVSVVIWYFVYINRHHDLRFATLNVGQGVALYIESPNGNTILVDGGPGNTLLEQLSTVMPAFDRDVDMIVSTDTTQSDTEGFVALLDRYTVGVSVEPAVTADTNAKSNSAWSQLQQKLVTKKIPIVFAEQGERVDIGAGAYIDILFSNSSSLVARLVYGKTSVIIEGNATQSVEQYLINQYGALIQSNILQVSDSGSKNTTSSSAFVKIVKPDVIMPSTGLVEYDSDGMQFVRVK